MSNDRFWWYLAALALASLTVVAAVIVWMHLPGATYLCPNWHSPTMCPHPTVIPHR